MSSLIWGDLGPEVEIRIGDWEKPEVVVVEERSRTRRQTEYISRIAVSLRRT